MGVLLCWSRIKTDPMNLQNKGPWKVLHPQLWNSKSLRENLNITNNETKIWSMSYFLMGTLSVNELGWYTVIKKKCSNMDLNKAFNLMLKCVPNATLGMHINLVVISILKNQLSMLSVVSQESSKWTMRQFSIPFFPWQIRVLSSIDCIYTFLFACIMQVWLISP